MANDGAMERIAESTTIRLGARLAIILFSVVGPATFGIIGYLIVARINMLDDSIQRLSVQFNTVQLAVAIEQTRAVDRDRRLAEIEARIRAGQVP